MNEAKHASAIEFFTHCKTVLGFSSDAIIHDDHVALLMPESEERHAPLRVMTRLASMLDMHKGFNVHACYISLHEIDGQKKDTVYLCFPFSDKMEHAL
mgnify:CR=1 FL=1